MTLDAAAREETPTPRQAPRLPGGRVPWVGHAAAFGRDPVAFLRRGRGRMGGDFAFTLMGQRVVFLCGRAAHEAVFRADETVLSPREAYRFMTPVFGPGVGYDAEPEEMSRQIGHLLPALTSRSLAGHVRLMEEEAEGYVAGWAERGEADLVEVMNDLTVAITTRCLFGAEFSGRLGPDLPRLYRDLESGIRLAGLVSTRLPLPSFRRRDRARATIGGALARAIEERRRIGRADAGRTGRTAPGLGRCADAEPRDVLAALMAARTPGGAPLPDETIIGLLIGMIFAGQHTSAVLAAWTGVLLLDDQARVTELLREQDEALGEEGPLDVPALRRMERLEWCVREAERLHPPLVILMRKALRDFAYGGRLVPAGALVMVSPAVSHRLPEVFRDPETYDPCRYGPGREEHAHPYALIGFGGGRHRCVGTAFAYQQVKVVWSVLLRRFDLELAEGPHLPDYSTLVPGPRSPCRVRYRRRGLRRAAAGLSEARR
ncbi:cytochrome P450 [Streptomyces sp. URMC 123]|uniref:cytochrome P450 n=1 Tax=Streptomyces sp. URMC 123 TaxID=3423403 RepID=UPI003F1A95E0